MINKEKLFSLYSILGISEDNPFGMHESAKKAVHHRENFSAFLEGRYQEIKPVTVEIVPSLECNFNCPNCTYIQNQSKQKDIEKKRLMSQDLFDLIINGLKEIHTKSIIFTGGGEPLMNNLYLKFMKQAVIENFEVGLYTNGALIGKNDIEQLLEIKPSFIRISLNAGTPESHSAMYGYKDRSNIFDKVVRNIIGLGKAKRKSNDSTTVGIGFIVSEKNFSEIDQTARLLLKIYEESENGIDYIAFRPEVYYFDNNKNVVTKQPNAKIFADISEHLEEKIGKIVRRSGMNVLINIVGFKHLSQPYQNIPNIATPWSASFDYDGRFYITSEHNGMDGFCMGDVKKTSVKEIWDDEPRKKLIEKMTTGQIKTLPFFKLKTLNDMLIKIRSLGTLSPEEIKGFYEKIKVEDIQHVNFM